MNRIVYSTATSQQRPHAVIDYDTHMEVFVSLEERIEISPQKMLEIVNGYVRKRAVNVTSINRLRIMHPDGVCELSPRALNALSHQYYRNMHLWDALPNLATVVNDNYTVVVNL